MSKSYEYRDYTIVDNGTGFSVYGSDGYEGQFESAEEAERYIRWKPRKRYTSPYERTRNAVYATRNQWAIETSNSPH